MHSQALFTLGFGKFHGQSGHKWTTLSDHLCLQTVKQIPHIYFRSIIPGDFFLMLEAHFRAPLELGPVALLSIFSRFDSLPPKQPPRPALKTNFGVIVCAWRGRMTTH